MHYDLLSGEPGDMVACLVPCHHVLSSQDACEMMPGQGQCR